MILEDLFQMQDLKYRDFQSKLVPNVPKELIIGVRTPMLRKYAKTIDNTPEKDAFLKDLPHKYYEENNLHTFIIENIKDYEKCMYETERFLPYIDNWATCDSFSPKVFKKYRNEVYLKAKEWISKEHVYTVRYGIDILMTYLNKDFNPEALETIAKIRSEEYYINMAIAWYFSMAIIKRYEETIVYITGNKLDKWVHNKSIQKTIESRQASEELRKYLRTLKR